MTRVDPVAADPAALAEAKEYLRLQSADQDALVGRLVGVAVAHGEAFTGQLFVARGASETLPYARAWQRLAATPVAAITAVSGLSALGVAVPLTADGYALDIDAHGDGWVRAIAPASGPTPPTRLVTAYTAGIAASWSGLPEGLRQGAVRLAAHLFTNRDSAEEGAPPAAVAALWRPWRRMRLT